MKQGQQEIPIEVRANILARKDFRNILNKKNNFPPKELDIDFMVRSNKQQFDTLVENYKQALREGRIK